MRSVLFLAFLTAAIPTTAPARSGPGAFTKQAGPSLLSLPLVGAVARVAGDARSYAACRSAKVL